MTLTVDEIQLLIEALHRAGNRCDTYARIGRGASKKFADKAAAMQTLAGRLSVLRARRDVLEVA